MSISIINYRKDQSLPDCAEVIHLIGVKDHNLRISIVLKDGLNNHQHLNQYYRHRNNHS